MINPAALILAVVFFVILGALFGGAETGIYQLSRLRLRLGIEKKRLSFLVLDRALRDRAALLLSILIGNNLAHYLATAIVTYILLGKVEAEHTAELCATLITAPTLFVFSELIPKSIFFYRSDALMPYVAPVLFAFHKLFSWCGAVGLLGIISRFFARLAGSPMPPKAVISAVQRPHIKAILQETHEESFLSSTQTDIINRLVSISQLSIRSVMTPINRVEMADVHSDKTVLLNKLKKSAFTRLPVYEQRPANVVGFINIYEALSSTEPFTDLHNFIKPIRKLAENTVVTEAINIMQSEKRKIVLVTRIGYANRENSVGVVTMKDLVEELLGELAQW